MLPAATPPPTTDLYALHGQTQAAAALPSAAPTTTYTVRWGDTVSGIAARYGTTIAAIVELNRLPDGGALIFVGQKLAIPAKGTPVPTTHPTTTTRFGPTLSWTVTADVLNVRRGPGTSHARTGHLVAGQVVTGRLDSRTGWVQLGEGRWAIGDWLRTSSPVSRTQTRPPVTTPTSALPDPAKQSVAQNLAWLRSHPAPSQAQLRTMITSTARAHGVDPRLALAVAMVESSHDHRQVSYCNAIGVMQVMPSTGQWINQVSGKKLNLLSAQDNITAGVHLLKILTAQARTHDEAIAGYYQGLYGVQTHGMLPDTKVYVARVRYWESRF